MIEYGETKTIAYAYDESGMIVGRVEASQEEHFYEKPHDYMSMFGQYRVVSAGYSVDLDFFEGSHDASRFSDAWNVFEEEFGDSEAADVFERWVRIFWPMCPVVRRTLRTGYSQGDWVEVIAWCDTGTLKREYQHLPVYEAASTAAGVLRSDLEVMEAIARHQFYCVTYTPATVGEVTVTEDDGDTAYMRATVEFSGVGDSVTTLAMSEFEPEAELLAVADGFAPFEVYRFEAVAA